MKVEELINKLNILKEEYGNIEVGVLDNNIGIDELNFIDVSTNAVDENKHMICIGYVEDSEEVSKK